MPELPEVETVVRSLRPLIEGRRILSAEFDGSRIFRGSSPGAAEELAGQRIERIGRMGKFIAVQLDRGAMAIHLGMTGRLLVDAEPTKWTHAVFTLDQGTLLYDDPRQFGRIEYGPTLPERLGLLGPEPLEITLSDFTARLKARRSPVKAALLNQSVLRGVGNIYADEALFRSGIRPTAVAASVGKARVAKLHAAVREVLSEAIESRGSSVSDYVDAEGRKGGFQASHRVYQRDGQPCVACGTEIRRIIVAQRGTHYCPKCQH